MEDTARLARLLSELSGGCWGVQEDRDAAGAIIECWPKAADAIRWHGRFRAAVAEDAVTRGITAVAFAEAGFPDGDPPHLAAAGASSKATFIYADRASTVTGQRRLSRSRATAGRRRLRPTSASRASCWGRRGC